MKKELKLIFTNNKNHKLFLKKVQIKINELSSKYKIEIFTDYSLEEISVKITITKE